MRRWTEVEFASLHRHPLMAATELAERIGRSIGGVEVVRWGVHEWHSGGNVSALSRMMLGILDGNRGLSTCSDCGAPL